MSGLRCVKCGYPCKEHSFVACPCELTQSESEIWATLRAAAIAHLREFVKSLRWKEHGELYPCFGTMAFEEYVEKLWMVADAYRSIGVLPKERKP